SGSKFLCSQVVAPIRNEDGDICMFIVNFEDVTDAPYKADEESSAREEPKKPLKNDQDLSKKVLISSKSAPPYQRFLHAVALISIILIMPH
ncbi:hypothetical protein IscW_ISCW003231, partial [Ixodes scapularis]